MGTRALNEDSMNKRTDATDPSTMAVDWETICLFWTTLTEMEKQWAHYQPFLQDHGYMLRPRYRPEKFEHYRGR